MEFLYSLINFIILAVIVVLMFGKSFFAQLRARRNDISHGLDEAERAPEGEEPSDAVPEQSPKQSEVNPDSAALKATYAAEDSLLRAELAQTCGGLRVDMLERTRKKLFAKLKASVAEVMKTEPFKAAFRAKEHDIAAEILSHIKLTPGDYSYLVKHDVLYVTLISAYPLEQRIIDCIDWATDDLLKQAGGKKSLWVRTDETLIGGIRLRIGDTIYDGSIEDILYRLTYSLSQNSISPEDDSKTLEEAFFNSIDGINTEIDIYQLGRVIRISDGICWLDGLADIMYGEVVEFDCGERGMILDIQSDKIGCVIFGKYENIESGNRVRRLGQMASVPVGEKLLGRVIDALGNPLDGLGRIWSDEHRAIENTAPIIPDRQPVNAPLHTGLKAIDALVPIGKGQRELIIGDRQTGKSAVAIDAILNQRGKNVICIYVAIGQKDIAVAELYSRLKRFGALSYTVIVSADAFSSASMQYIAPFSATAVGEYFMYSGRDVLIIYDDLSKHAVAYRELSLLLQRPSGREAYPGDVFYLHARLLERSAHLCDRLGGGSMTALPIIETLAGDISAYIPTNTISITDGQIFLESELFNAGQRPAINVGLSVSRVGSAAQTKLMKFVSSHLRTDLAQYRELAGFSQFGADLDESSKRVLAKGEAVMAVLRQPRNSPMPDAVQALSIYAVANGYSAGISPDGITAFEKSLCNYMYNNYPDIMAALEGGAKPDEALCAKLNEALKTFSEGL